MRLGLGEGHCQGEVLLLVQLRLSVGAYVLSFKYVDIILVYRCGQGGCILIV